MKKRTLVSVACAVTLMFAAAGCSSVTKDAAAPGQTTVKTSYGPVTGTQENTVLVWYGIPYGKEPSGSLRWQAPQNPDPWKEPLVCTAPGTPALQLSGSTVTGTEDCLRLTVYADRTAHNAPVLVYVHGGNNQTGNSGEIPGFDLVKNTGCVYVSVDYRLGLLGFNCLPALTSHSGGTGNYSMLDLAASLDWIKKNIRQFGGDPANVTVSGFSAGGRDVMAMLISPLFKNKFQKAVVFSGGMTTAPTDLSSRKIAAALSPLAVADGRAADTDAARTWLLSDSDDVRSYLCTIQPERLAALMGNAGIRMSVFPHLYRDDVVIPAAGFDTTAYQNVPVLMLTGSTEFSLFCLFDGFFSGPEMAQYTKEQIDAAKSFGVRYGSDMYRIFNTQMSAEKMISRYRNAIYLCQINYGSSSSAVQNLGAFGAFHGIFVPLLSEKNNYTAMFGKSFAQPGYKAMAREFNGYLTQFLKTGSPNDGTRKDWPRWTDGSKQTMVFDATDTGAVIGAADVSSSYERILDAMDADTTLPPDLKALVISRILNGRWFSQTLDARYHTANLWN
jgi:para-nitrobenzyl esterase